MPENTIVTFSPPDLHAMDLPVALEGGLITVSSGIVKADGQDYSLEEDETFTVVSRPVLTEVIGYLVLDTFDNDSLRLFVEEIEDDGESAPYDFARGDQYTLLFYLFQVLLPADTADLAVLDYNRWVVTEQPNV